MLPFPASLCFLSGLEEALLRYQPLAAGNQAHWSRTLRSCLQASALVLLTQPQPGILVCSSRRFKFGAPGPVSLPLPSFSLTCVGAITSVTDIFGL